MAGRAAAGATTEGGPDVDEAGEEGRGAAMGVGAGAGTIDGPDGVTGTGAGTAFAGAGAATGWAGEGFVGEGCPGTVACLIGEPSTGDGCAGAPAGLMGEPSAGDGCAGTDVMGTAARFTTVGGGAAAVSAAVGVIGFPHAPQKRAPSSISAAQWGQVAIVVPARGG
jgi:hypothetical protein